MSTIQYAAQPIWRPNLASHSQVGSYMQEKSPAVYVRPLHGLVSTTNGETSSEEDGSDGETSVDGTCIAEEPEEPTYRLSCRVPPPLVEANSISAGRRATVTVPASSTVRSKASSAARKRVPTQRVSLLDAFLPKSAPGRSRVERSTASQTATAKRSARRVVPIAPPASLVSSYHTIKHIQVNSSQLSAASPMQTRRPRSTVSIISSPSKSTSARLKTCITCLSDDLPVHRTAKLECHHRMCFPCLRRLFVLSTTDPQLMPPRCCDKDSLDSEIPLHHVAHLFDDKFKRLWNRKYLEYNTKDRLYCPTKGCGTWIKPKYIKTDREINRKFGTCKHCKGKVCKRCGSKWHGRRRCGDDQATDQVLEMGKTLQWQRCFSCKTMVQLAEGCNHMRCRCNAEFCYKCGSKWKTCDCPWFDVPPDVGSGGFAGERRVWNATTYRVRFVAGDDGTIIVEEEDPVSRRPMSRPPAARQAEPDIQSSSRRVVPSTVDDAIGENHSEAEESNRDAFDETIARELQEEEIIMAGTAGMGLAGLSLLDPTPPVSGRSSPRSTPRSGRRHRHWASTERENETGNEIAGDIASPVQEVDDQWVTRLQTVEIGESLHGTDEVAVRRAARADRRRKRQKESMS